MTGKVRSGRTGGVVVVGRGPLADAVTAWLVEHPVVSGGARAVADLPVVGAAEELGEAAAVVLVADDADLRAVRTGGPQERRDVLVALAQRTVAAAREAGVPRLVAITSAMVHGAAPGRAVIGDAEVPPTELPEGQVGDLVAVESVLARAAARSAGPTVLVLRPAAVVGPGVDTLVTRHFAAPRLLTVRGAERPWQMVHVDDVASAVALAIEQGWSGAATVGAGTLEARQVERLAGMRRVELAAVAAFGIAERLHRVGVLPVPAAEMAFVVYPWSVEPARLLEAGWSPVHDAEDCLRVLLDGVRGSLALAGRQVAGRDMALGAAGAAVALLGTAAAWRQARARHG